MSGPFGTVTNIKQFYTSTKIQKYICCANSISTTKDPVTQNPNCQPISNYTSAISHITDLPCFTPAWYSTSNGQIKYLKTEGGAYYTTKGGETYYTTGTGNLIPILDPAKVSSGIIFATTHTFNGQSIFNYFNKSNLNNTPFDQPITNFTTSMFKISNGQKSYYDYQLNEPIVMFINLHDYNLRNFIKIGNYFEIKGGTGYIDDLTNNDTRLMSPYCGVTPNTINLLTTLVSYRLIDITKKTCSLKNYIPNLFISCNMILANFYKQMIAQICKTYDMSWKNPEDKKMIVFLFTYINKQSPFLLSIFQNWYLNQFSEISVYCLQLSVKISFFISQLQQLLGNLSVQMNDDINNAFYGLVWKYMIGGKKLTIKKLNKIFSVFANGANVFPQHYCCIIKKWFGIIDNTTDMTDLSHIEVGTKTMSQEELYNASLCPKNILYYKRLLEIHFALNTVRLKLHDYVVTVGRNALEASGNTLSDAEKIAIIEHGLEQRIKRIIG